MTKPTITRLFLGSIGAIVAGLVLGFLAVVVAYGGGAFIMVGPDVAGIRPTALGAATAVTILIALVALVAGGVAGLVAWLGALLNTAQLDNKAWFLIVLALGVWNFGIIAMILYVVAGPDAFEEQRVHGTAYGASVQ